MLESMYNAYERYAEIVGADRWVGPKGRLSHAEDVLVAQYDKDPGDGDGQDVDLYLCMWPATFAMLVAHPPFSDNGEPFVIRFGSGCVRQAHEMALMMSEGMLGCHPYTYDRLAAWKAARSER